MNADFIDTNILVYLFSVDEKEKRLRAEELVQRAELLISTQVINEFVNVMFRKFSLSASEVDQACRELELTFRVSVVTQKTIFNAIRLKGRYGFSYFDALMVSSALEERCQNLYTEDMQHGQVVEDNLTIVNPFL
jgi:predicted nucleic acid-binding protein